MLSVYDHLLKEPYGFDFFQAVRLLWKRRSLLEARSEPVPHEVARFKAHLSLSFPPSAIQSLIPDPDGEKPHQMTVAFLGLFGPSGVLPHQYTQRIIGREYRHSRDSVRDALSDADRALYDRERRALRDWLDLFNHQLIDKFYHAWDEYHFYVAYERQEPDRDQPDTFTHALYSLLGLGLAFKRTGRG